MKLNHKEHQGHEVTTQKSKTSRNQITSFVLFVNFVVLVNSLCAFAPLREIFLQNAAVYLAVTVVVMPRPFETVRTNSAT